MLHSLYTYNITTKTLIIQVDLWECTSRNDAGFSPPMWRKIWPSWRDGWTWKLFPQSITCSLCPTPQIPFTILFKHRYQCFCVEEIRFTFSPGFAAACIINETTTIHKQLLSPEFHWLWGECLHSGSFLTKAASENVQPTNQMSQLVFNLFHCGI